MRRTKITTAVALIAASASLLLLGFTSLAEGERMAPITAEFTGIGGQVFQRGQNVEIKWILSGDGVRALESNRWSECELFFSAGGKAWTRITPVLSVSRRSYDWMIPDVSEEQGIIAIQIGIEGEGEFYFFRSEPFTIRRR
jgi:hypothetical protein